MIRFSSFGKAVSEENFLKSTNQKEELSVAAMFVNGSGRNEPRPPQAILVSDWLIF
jgi:hypothetical protein